MEKTNAMRLLDQSRIAYFIREYSADTVDGGMVAESLGEDPDRVFKTLVTKNQTTQYFVFCVPVSADLDLKKAAKAVGAKSIEMIHQKELLPLTGYVHGGCSPVGMKKRFVTYMDESALLYDEIFVSGGKRGLQIAINPNDLAKIAGIKFADLTSFSSKN